MNDPNPRIGTQRIVRDMNRKLSKSHQAVFRSEGRPEPSKEAYTFLDTVTRERRYLSLAELLGLARELGVIPRPIVRVKE